MCVVRRALCRAGDHVASRGLCSASSAAPLVAEPPLCALETRGGAPRGRQTSLRAKRIKMRALDTTVNIHNYSHTQTERRLRRLAASISAFTCSVYTTRLTVHVNMYIHSARELNVYTTVLLQFAPCSLVFLTLYVYSLRL